MRIAILNWRDQSHPDAGGAESIIHQVARRWAQRGHEVSLFSSSLPELPEADTDGDLQILRIGRLRDGSHHLRAPGKLLSRRPDVILESVNTLPYMLPLRGSLAPSLPLVHQLARDVWRAHLPSPVATLMARLEPLLWVPYRRRMAAVYSQSTKTDLHAVGVSNVKLIPQGGGGPGTPGKKAPVPTFIFAGRLARNKRPHHAVAAFRIIREVFPQAQLWILGDGEMRAELASQLPPGAELLGRLDHDQVLKRMGQAHVVLVPSVREGWGLVVTEANSVGSLAVGYDVPGLRDSVRQMETGLLTPPEPSALARAAISLFRAPSLYSRMRENAIAWASSFTWETMAAALMNQLEKVASREQDTHARRYSA